MINAQTGDINDSNAVTHIDTFIKPLNNSFNNEKISLSGTLLNTK